MRVLVVVSTLLVMSIDVLRAEEAGVMGYGVGACAKFAQFYQKDPDRTEDLFYAWALGFMTGLNTAGEANKLPTRNLAAQPQREQKRFLRAWCNSHPLANYAEGVVELMKTLPHMSN
jgi:hypothetical protein